MKSLEVTTAKQAENNAFWEQEYGIPSRSPHPLNAKRAARKLADGRAVMPSLVRALDGLSQEHLEALYRAASSLLSGNAQATPAWCPDACRDYENLATQVVVSLRRVPMGDLYYLVSLVGGNQKAHMLAHLVDSLSMLTRTLWQARLDKILSDHGRNQPKSLGGPHGE